jgi:DNA ligase-1
MVLLLAAYNPENDTFETVTECGIGYTDEDLSKLPRMLQEHVVRYKHPRVNSTLRADVRFEPNVTVEILRRNHPEYSPRMRCGLYSEMERTCYRVPKFTGNHGWDKAPEDMATSGGMLEMCPTQLKKIIEAWLREE